MVVISTRASGLPTSTDNPTKEGTERVAAETRPDSVAAMSEEDESSASVSMARSAATDVGMFTRLVLRWGARAPRHPYQNRASRIATRGREP